jgi:hypothetical protein
MARYDGLGPRQAGDTPKSTYSDLNVADSGDTNILP